MARFSEIADVSFMGNITLAGLKKTAIEEYAAAYTEITGKDITVSDEDKAALYTVAQIFYQLAETIDTKARQNLLKYSSGAYLDNLALSKGLIRKKEENSVVTVRFTLSAARHNTVEIPKGTRITNAANKIYFATADYAEIPAGGDYVDILCISVGGGTAANNFSIGELNILADPIAYISAVSNIDIPSGGADAETDDALAERIFEARNLYSTAGSENSYIYYTKSYSTLIDDVVVTNPKDAEIYIYILMKDRKEASSAFIEDLTDYLNSGDTRPITDKITVKNVERINYEIDIKYNVVDSDISHLTEIQGNIAAAVETYKIWQSEKIGRDIDSQELLALLRMAGARNIKINYSQSAIVGKQQIAYCTNTNITYLGAVEN